MRKETFICDIKDCKNDADHQQRKLQVIFTSDQTEGRPVNPYLDDAKLDLCQVCMSKVLLGDAIWAVGAQGHNVYRFKPKNE